MEPTTAQPQEQMHRLLRRQTKRHLGDPDGLPPSWQPMLAAVNEAYLHFESDYALLERSLELSSQELRAANSGMRATYERLIQSSVDGIFAFDHQGCCTVWNAGMEPFTGFSQLQTIGKSLFELFPSLEGTGFGAIFRAVLAGETVYREVAAGASRVLVGESFLECYFAPLLSEAGAIIGGLGVLRDVTGRKLAEEAMRKQHDSLAALQEMALRLTSKMELQGLLTDILDRACLLMETPHAFLALVEPERSAMLVQFATGTMQNAMGRAFLPEEPTLIAEVWRTREPVVREHYQGLSEIQYDPLHGWVVVPLLQGSEVIGALGVVYADSPLDERGVSENEVALLKQFAQLASIGLVHGALNEANARLATLAATDTLTGLPNRTSLLERIEQALPRAARREGQMALLMLDLNRFKEVNDTFGHQCGDLLLQQVGQRLGQAVDAAATVSRLGGDEFAVFLPTADEAEAREVARAIGAALEEAFLVEDSQHHIEASIGIALYPAHGSDALTLLRHADVAMYVAKGRHEGYALYDAQHDQYSPRRLALLGDLRRAIATGQLRLYYQPKAELSTGLVTSVEALVRWQHPAHGFMPPDQFIPLAEQTGLIAPLTCWVVETAIAQCRRWLDAGLALSVAVNLSMWNLRDTRLPETVAGLLAQYRVPAQFLCLEVTESAVMTDAEHTLRVLGRLFDLGARIAIDDYGTGYASLAYLKRLPADELKIDRAFVKQMSSDRADQAIVRSTVNMAHSLGIRVVAEGVEDQETWSLLGRLRCDIAQGYYLSRPVAAADLERWLGERQAAFPLTANTGLGSETALATV